MARTHHFPDDQVHFTWDAGNEPVLTVESGDTVVVHTRDVSDNQITPGSTTADIARLDWDRVYPLAGPIAVDGAEPGDTLAVEVLDIRTEGWDKQPVMPPGLLGGNMDPRQLNQGTTLFLPVHVEKALFSTGDAHGVQ